MDNFSPMIKQYLSIKQQHQDCIVLFRLGDFYELFFEDAENMCGVLDLVLTSKDCGGGKRASMCGIPYHALDGYVQKLLMAGQKVAICEQLSEPNKKGIVERDIVRIITPGTVIDSSLLDEKTSNFIASVYCVDEGVAAAVCDLSTGFFSVQQFSPQSALKELQEFLVSFKPSEIICNASSLSLNEKLDCVKAGYVPKFAPTFDWTFDLSKAKSTILNHYKILSLKGFSLEGKNLAISASGALLEYLNATQKRELPHLNPIKLIEKNIYMSIDVKTRKNLELTVSSTDKKKGSLLWLLDKTLTSMGARLLRDWIDRPLQNATMINNRLDSVEELYKNYILSEKLSNTLSAVKDIERLAGKIAYNNLSPRDCNSIAASLKVLPQIKTLLLSTKTACLRGSFDSIMDLSEVESLLNSAIVDNAPSVVKDGGVIKRGFNKQLDELIDISQNSKGLIADLEEYERNRTGIKTLKLGYNRVFGYFFEISKGQAQNAPEDFIRKQTLANAERFASPKLKELEEKILGADEKILQLEKALFAKLREQLLPYIPDFQKTAYGIALCDCLLSLAKVASRNDYCKPKINSKDKALQIIDGRHPVVETYVKREKFIPNDTLLDVAQNRTMIITGPNMAGKSTYMRQVALITLMAHIGSFVPAKSALIPVTDRIFTRIGASDDLLFNQSTFMVEMVEVSNIINNATEKSLVVLDEIGRGTSTFDGLAIAWAVIEFMSEKIRAKTLFSTHFHELTELEGKVDGIKNYKILVKEFNDGIVFLHKIARGGANKSFGIEVASLAGVPFEVTSRAKQIVELLEDSDANIKISKIDEQKREVKENNRIAKEAIAVLKDLDINRISPIEAFDILNDLIKKVKNEQN